MTRAETEVLRKTALDFERVVAKMPTEFERACARAARDRSEKIRLKVDAFFEERRVADLPTPSEKGIEPT